MVPHAILLDLDETLIDRTLSIARYAERFHRDFADHLAPLAVSTLAATILTADKRGYRPRKALFRDLLQQLPWQTPPEVVRLHFCPSTSRGGLPGVPSVVCGGPSGQ